MRALLLLLLLWAAPLAAQGPAGPWPARHSVTGVAADDVLNVRAAPSASAEILAALPPGARGVEVLGLSPDGAWARVPLPEGEGWVAARFLAREEGPLLVPPLVCLGTEPFWALSLSRRGALWETPEGAVPLRPLGAAEGFSGGVLAFDRAGGTLDLTVVRGACSDGMSDRPYGLTALVWDRGGELLEGCCTLGR
jgi:hypothetical protein